VSDAAPGLLHAVMLRHSRVAVRRYPQRLTDVDVLAPAGRCRRSLGPEPMTARRSGRTWPASTSPATADRDNGKGWSIVVTMATQALPTVVVLNGASSVGKPTLAVALQDLLPKPFLHVGVDTLLAAMPPSSAGIAVADEGSVAVAGDLRRLELAWYAGLAAMASSGARLIIDEVFLTGKPPSNDLPTRSKTFRPCGSACTAGSTSQSTGRPTNLTGSRA